MPTIIKSEKVIRGKLFNKYNSSRSVCKISIGVKILKKINIKPEERINLFFHKSSPKILITKHLCNRGYKLSWNKGNFVTFEFRLHNKPSHIYIVAKLDFEIIENSLIIDIKKLFKEDQANICLRAGRNRKLQGNDFNQRLSNTQ